jgi:hypothetical protein
MLSKTAELTFCINLFFCAKEVPRSLHVQKNVLTV